MSVYQRLDGVYGRLAQRCRGILARAPTADDAADSGVSDSARRWKPRPGQAVLVVTICDASAHRGLDTDVIGCRGRVSAIEREDDHPYEVLVTLSERIYLYGRFAVGELAPLSRAIRPSEPSQPRDRLSPPGARPQMAVALVDGPVAR